MATAVAGDSVRRTVALARQIGWAIHDAAEGLLDPRHDIETADAADVRAGRPLVSVYCRDASLRDVASDIHLYGLDSAGPCVAERLREFADKVSGKSGARHQRFAARIRAAADRIERI